MLLADFTFGQALLTVLEIFLFAAWLMVLFTILGDLFNHPDFSIAKDFSFGRVMSFAAVIGLVNTVIFTVLGAIAAVLYNMIVKITGGLLVGFTNA